MGASPTRCHFGGKGVLYLERQFWTHQLRFILNKARLAPYAEPPEISRLRNQLAELKRRQAATRKRDLCQLANLVFSLGGTVRIEKNSFKAFQRVFGKSVARRAPGYLISEIKRKAACAGAEVEELDARRYRLSQYDFWTDAYVKKPLSQRWHKMGDTDVYGIWTIGRAGF